MNVPTIVTNDLPLRRLERGRGTAQMYALVRFCRTQPLSGIGLAILTVLVLCAALAPLISPYNPILNNTGPPLGAPSSSHLFGTDQYGRDLFSRVIYGARTSLGIALATGVIAAIVATALGIISAYYERGVDFVLQRIVDTVQSIPTIVFLIAIMVTFGVTIPNIIVALAVSTAIGMIRIIRSSALGVISRDYIGAARSIGAGGPWIMLRHVLPNVFPITLVLSTVSFGGIIIAESTLSFLGLGIKPPTPAWGAMLSGEGLAYMFVAWWLLLFPTLALSLAVFAINMFGDGLRDWLDPRRRGIG